MADSAPSAIFYSKTRTGDSLAGCRHRTLAFRSENPSPFLRRNPMQGVVSSRLSRPWQVKDSPDIDTDRPVSRQLESNIFNHYAWDPY
jgi:hypothetical protein